MDFRERTKRFLTWKTPVVRKRVQKNIYIPALEEETLSNYDNVLFYPARIGQCLDDQYIILAKLGYGRRSTVWFCFDKEENCYVIVKIGVARYEQVENFDSWDSNEMATHNHFGKIKTSHRGCLGIRNPGQVFPILSTEPGAWHLCIAFEPALCDMSTFASGYESGVIEEVDCIKSALKQLILTLDFLHTEAKTIHCDIKMDNVLLTTEDPCAYREAAKALGKHRPVARWDGDQFIYESINLCAFIKQISWGRPMLSDFGEARTGVAQGEQLEPEVVGAGPYRPPEARLGMSWGSPVDIWAVGVLAWFMLHGKFVFQLPSQQVDGDAHYLSRMASVMGPPPKEFIQENQVSQKFWNENGEWLGHGGVEMPEASSFEEMEDKLEGGEKTNFLNFIRSTLAWKPEDRKTAKELVEDPWLNSF